MFELKSKKSPNKSNSKSTTAIPKKNKIPHKKSQKNTDHSKQEQQFAKLKKRIQQMDPPDLLLKLLYKGKKLSVPLKNIQNKSLRQLLQPYLIRVQKEIFKNYNFEPRDIMAWKTINRNILKDYYLQLQKPVSIFKNQIIELQPIWRTHGTQEVTIKDFQIIKCIGTGGFSKVFLVRKITTGKFYALKLMEKSGLVDGKECVVTNELEIMRGLDNPYVLRLEYAFQTKNFVAFALEYCPGGQLFHYLRKIRKFTEDQARYCFIEILTGFRYLHQNNIIYRDIKPENIIIDADGHLKIADFGLSKIIQNARQKSYTYCGSPQYMAPQMLSKTGHGFPVDYYCLGALLFQLVTGNPPFYSRDVDKIFQAIKTQQISIPQYLSSQIADLLEGLLIKDPKKRLGTLGGIREILGHPWVRRLKIPDVVQKKIATPVKVDLMIYNVNAEEIGNDQDELMIRLQNQVQNYEPRFQRMFDNFYFDRHNKSNSESVMINSSSKNNIYKIQENFNLGSKSKKKQSTKDNLQKRVGSGHKEKRLKPNKSKKKLNQQLVQRAKLRDQKSFKKNSQNKRDITSKISNYLQKTENTNNKTLKRIKSSGALRVNYLK